METLNIRYFAFLYYQEIEPGKYDWNNRKHRYTMRTSFVKLVNRDEKAMERALKKYLDTVKMEAAELKKG